MSDLASVHELETMAFDAIGQVHFGGVDWKHLTRDLIMVDRKLDPIGWFADFNYADHKTNESKPEHSYTVEFTVPNSSMIVRSDIAGDKSIFGMLILISNSRVVHTELYGLGNAERPKEFLGVLIAGITQDW